MRGEFSATASPQSAVKGAEIQLWFPSEYSTFKTAISVRALIQLTWNWVGVT